MDKLLANPMPIIYFAIIVIATITIDIFVKKYFNGKIINKAEAHHIDATSFIFITHMITSIIYLFGFGWALLVLPVTRTFAHSLLAGAGASTLILGFASQQLFTNLISGVFLVVTRPFKIGDLVEIQGDKGTVVEINLNATLLKDEDNNNIIIPSSLILNDKIKIYTKS
jgi:small-conductance mechanosensitive channel